MTREGDESVVVRVDDLVPAGPSEPGPDINVVGVLRPADPAGVRRAVAVFDECDVVVVQHEFGIYGGPDGDEVLSVLAALRRPSIVVLHTVLSKPTRHQRSVIMRIAELAHYLVVMTHAAADILTTAYGISASRVSLIPHGAEPWAPVAPSRVSARPVVLTWGLIGPGKGIEWGIRAIAELSDMDPAPVYRVLGQTHPKVRLDHGEQYRRSLIALADELGVAGRTQIEGGYLTLEQLAGEVASADVVLLPYDSRDQTTSGVLAEAVAAGKLVIATRFPHARELLGAGGGILVGHERPREIADAIRASIHDPGLALQATENARAAAESASWPVVAEAYRALVGQALMAERSRA
jgi:glycosyltransferase involved in cell wall biosynthesis